MENMPRFYHILLMLYYSRVTHASIVKREYSQEIPVCNGTLTLCHDGQHCVDKSHLCDGQSDCGDQSDESYCGLSNCSSSEFPCMSGDCVTRSHVCDNVHDCHDGSDEIICDPVEVCVASSTDKYLCTNRKQCIHRSRLCDNNYDCWDRSDEDESCDVATAACKSNYCDHICEPTPGGAVCSCRNGYKLVNDSACIDVDECKDQSACSQFCVNYPGGYNCSCSVGYHLENSGRCRADGPEPLILVALRTEIVGLYPYSNKTKDILSDRSEVSALAYGPGQTLYFTDMQEKAVYKLHLEGHNDKIAMVVIDTGLERPEGIAVDWSSGHLYITDSRKKHIVVCTPDGKSCLVLIDKLHFPRAITIDPTSRTLFWSDLKRNDGIIERSDLDGQNRVVVVNNTLGQPNRLVVDGVLGYLYWTDSKLHRIERIKIDGSHRKVMVSRTLDHPFGIAVFEDMVYWSDVALDSLSSRNVRSLGDITVLLKNLHDPVDMTVVHPVLYQNQPFGSLCMSSDCDDICLPSNSSHRFTCACSIDRILSLDGVHCNRNASFAELLIGVGYGIIQLPLSSIGKRSEMSRTIEIDQLKNPFSIAVDLQDGSIVYSDSPDRDVIAKIYIDSVNIGEKILFKDLQIVQDLVVDMTTGNIFWVDTGKGTIEVGSSNGKYHSVLVNDTIQRPNSLDIDTTNGYLYFSDVGKNPYIGMCYMDGTHCQPLNIAVGRPNDISLDVETGRLYLTDGHSKQIISVKVPDGNRRIVHWISAGKPYSLAVDSDWLYWTDDDTDTVYKMNKRFSHDNEPYIVLDDIGKLKGIALWNPKKAVIGINSCQKDNGNCSHLCVPNPHGRSCFCSDGWLLSNDMTTCIEQPKPVNCSSGSNGCHGDNFVRKLCPDGSQRCEGIKAVIECRYHDDVGFLCGSGECVPYSHVCDNDVDCADSSDEGNMCETACKNQTVCQQVCKSTPIGSICSCHHGYLLNSDSRTCSDIDECSHRNGGCSQICNNIDGGYQCHCIKEYHLNSVDPNKCIVHDPRPYLIISSEEGLIKVQDNGQSVQLPIGPATGMVTTIDVAMDTGNIYFAAIYHSRTIIHQYDSATKNVTMVTGEEGYITDIAYDWIGNNLYVANDKTPSLSVCILEPSRSTLCKVLSSNIKIESIVVYPAKGLMFFINSDKKSISKCWMDGQHEDPIVTSDLVLPSGITIDYPADRLYWVDAGRDTIETCKLDGTDRYTVLNEHGFYHFKAIDVFEDLLFVGDWKKKSVYKYNKFGGTLDQLGQYFHHPTSVKVVHPLKQLVHGLNPCSTIRCSRLCLLTPTGARCDCPSGFWFVKNSTQNCTDEIQTTTVTMTTMKTGTTATTTSYSPTSRDPVDRHRPVHQDKPINKNTPKCLLSCLNGGICHRVNGQGHPYCMCPENFSGRLCENEINAPPEGLSENRQYRWVAGLVVGIIIIVVIVISLIYCFRLSRDDTDFQKCLNCSSLRCSKKDDSQQLVADLSFASTNLSIGNPVFQEEDAVEYPVVRQKKSKWYTYTPNSPDAVALIKDDNTDSGINMQADNKDSPRSSSSGSSVFPQ